MRRGGGPPGHPHSEGGATRRATCVLRCGPPNPTSLRARLPAPLWTPREPAREHGLM